MVRGSVVRNFYFFLEETSRRRVQPGQKTTGNFPNFLKESTCQMFGYPDWDAGLNTSHMHHTSYICIISSGFLAYSPSDWSVKMRL